MQTKIGLPLIKVFWAHGLIEFKGKTLNIPKHRFMLNIISYLLGVLGSNPK
jgi:hypothetical protein